MEGVWSHILGHRVSETWQAGKPEGQASLLSPSDYCGLDQEVLSR
jgi:hypothetical protein